ncbi:MAG: TonB-dependent receptor [Bryobacterales bacterium]|nr:TonB-dependent receptor [Bryobacterales bacterium]
MRWVVFLLIALRAVAASITGEVSDENGLFVADARVDLLAGSTTLASTRTDSSGRFTLTDATPAGAVLEVRKAGFAVQRLVAGPGATPLAVTLAVGAQFSEITVTAGMGATEAGEAPRRVAVVSADDVARRFTTVLADIVREEAGVDSQRTGSSMGGIFVRGVTGKNVAIYRDGVRYTTSAQRGGVSTFFNLSEPTGLDTFEILRGPDSAQYGSDAVGGTVHMVSQSPSLDGWRGEFAPLYNSAAHSFGGNLLLTYGTERWGVLTNLANRRVNTLRTGRGIDSRAAVTRFLGLPSTVLGDRLPDTAFTQYGGMVRGQYAVTQSRRLIGHYERSQQDGGKRYDQLLGGDGNLIAQLHNLMLDFGYLRYQEFAAGPLDELNVSVSYNAQREERENQGGQGNPLGTITRQYERQTVWGTQTRVGKQAGRHTLEAGADGYFERMRSPSFTYSPASGVLQRSRPRVPDGARYAMWGVYAQDSWTLGRLRLNSAIRHGVASYRSRAVNAPVVAGTALFPDDSLRVANLTGRGGATFLLTRNLRVHGHWSRGFRAPSMTDLGTLGLQGNGFFEAAVVDLAGHGATIGDGAGEDARPSGRQVAPIRSETSQNFEGGFHWTDRRTRAGVTYWSMDLTDAIVSQTLLLPQGAVGSLLGDQTIVRQIASGAVFVTLSAAPVQVRGNLTGARFRGVEQTFETRISSRWTVRQNFTWTHAREDGNGAPPDLEGGVPPPTIHLSLLYAPAKRYWIEAYTLGAHRQTRLSSLALADRRTGAARSRSAIANFFNRGAAVRGLVAGGRLLPTGETLAEVQTRVLGDAASAPLFAAQPGYLLLGMRGGYRIGENADLYLDLANLTDRNYRGMGWGIDGPGRSVTLGCRWRF